jgi:signal transduction histidine kinase
MEKVSKSFYVENDSLIITNYSEFNESDFVYLTESPFFLQVYDFNKKILLQSKNLRYFHEIEISIIEFNVLMFFHDELSFNNNLRVAYQKLYNNNQEHIGFIQLSTLKDRFAQVFENLILVNAAIFPIALILIFIASLWIANKSFAPVRKIIEVADKISASNLSERIHFHSDPQDDLTKLKNTLNNLFDRLESQIKQMSEFTDNASHQLMTPLTALNTELEYQIKVHSNSKEILSPLKELKETTNQMISIVKALLILSKDAKSISNNNSVFNLSNLLNNKLAAFYKQQNLNINSENNLYLRGSEEFFLIAIQNIVDNAVKYSNNKIVNISAKLSEHNLIIQISDCGVGIPDAEKEKIFERFFRGMQAENLGVKGYGLGLSLAQFIINAMNGEIDVLPNYPTGSIFSIKLPKLDFSSSE